MATDDGKTATIATPAENMANPATMGGALAAKEAAAPETLFNEAVAQAKESNPQAFIDAAKAAAMGMKDLLAHPVEANMSDIERASTTPQNLEAAEKASARRFTR
jgi:hypothetical protein